VRGQLEGLSVQLPARAGEGGRLFGSVTAADIVAAVKAAGGPEVDRRRIQMPRHIKSLGSYDVTVALHTDVSATVSVNVVRG